MDEDAFKKSFLNKSVFKNQAVLDFSYVTEKLFFRDEAINTLLFFYKRILDEKEIPAINYLILGIEGVGKTCTARWFGRNFKKVAMEKDVNLLVEYYNCIHFRSKSKIMRQLLAKYTHGSGRGFCDDEVLKLIMKQLINERSYLMLIIDEVHLLKPDEILALLDIAETYGHQNAKLSIILISRSKDWMRIETERILSRINQKIKLKPYKFEEVYEILKDRCKLAFKSNVVTKDSLFTVSQIVMNHQNLRHGVEILRKSGIHADKEGLDQITKDMIKSASNDLYPTLRIKIIDQLKDHELLTLMGIVRSLLNSDEPFIIVTEAYQEYEDLCERYNVRPHAIKTFRKYLQILSKLRLISSRTVRIEETERGPHLEISLIDITPEKFKLILEEILEKKF